MTDEITIDAKDLSKLLSAASTLIGFTRGASSISLSLSDNPDSYIEAHAKGLRQESAKAEIALEKFSNKYILKRSEQ